MIFTTEKSRLSAVERLERALARIHPSDVERTEAFTSVFENSARREAEASDARAAAGVSYGPLRRPHRGRESAF